MHLFSTIIQNIIYIIVPILVYFFFTICQKVKNERIKDLYLFLSLITSLYLFFKYGTVIQNDKSLLLCNIPIIIAYYKKKQNIGITLSIFVIVYCYYNIPSISLPIIIIKYLLYILIYYLLQKKDQTTQKFVNFIAILQGFFITFEYISSKNLENDFFLLIEVFILVLTLYIITFGIIYIFEMGNRANEIYLSYHHLKKEKQIRDSLFKITHEIKNPIAVCKGYIDMFNPDDPVKSSKYISIIKQEIERTLNILNDFSEIGKIKIEKDLIDINLLLEETIESVTILYSEKNVKIKYHKSKEEVYLYGDYHRLKQVLVNILKNCFESITKKKGLIEIETYIQDKYFYLVISDNGVGMDDYTLNKVKEVFYTTKKYGSGLGIPLSLEIIEAHQGTIKYESKQNKGTKTIINLPLN